jgi:predicted RNA binding protein YcfA (HicA-like mRNA interferase family)
MSNVNLINELSDSTKVEIFNQICQVKQSEIAKVLREVGFEWVRGRKSSADYKAADQEILQTLGEYQDGLKASILQFFVVEQKGVELNPQQFNARVASLAKSGQIVPVEGKRGFYRVA